MRRTPPDGNTLFLADTATLGRQPAAARAESAGFEITPSTPQALSERIEADIAPCAPLIREGRIARL